MGFQMKFPDREYQARLAADQSDGYCVGQCVTWVLDLLEKKADSLRPANVNIGSNYQNMYAKMFHQHKASADASNAYNFKVIAYLAKTPATLTPVSRSIKEEVALTNAMSRALIEGLRSNYGNAFLLMQWDDLGSNSPHMIVLMKNKKKECYLYDPNFGVFAHRLESKTLYDDIKSHLIGTRTFVNPEAELSLLLSTPLDLKINS